MSLILLICGCRLRLLKPTVAIWKEKGEMQRNVAMKAFTAGVNCMIIKHSNSQAGEAKD